MTPVWDMPPEPEPQPIKALGWLRLVLRLPVLAVLVFGGLAILLVLRGLERPLFGQRRPVTPYITQFVCRNALRILGVGYKVSGAVMTHPGAVVANHASWLDIFVLNARKRIYFVSKAEVAGWPGIGWLARATGTVFITRNPKEAKRQQALFEKRLLAGHKLLFFPEGTSTDGLVVLPFKSTLFQAFFSQNLKDRMYIQPCTVAYFGPEGDARFFGWWGGMDFGGHLLKIAASGGRGRVEVQYHPPLKVSAFPNRKEIALAAEQAVRSGMDQARG